MTLNIAIAGAAGRMGRMLIDTVTHRGGICASGALEHDGFTCLLRRAPVWVSWA